MLQHSRGARRLGRVGLGLVSVTSMLAFAGAASAAAHEISPAYLDQNGHFEVPLTPGEVPGGGDTGGKGSAVLNLNKQLGQACFSIKWQGLQGNVTALHLHVAGAGSDGPHWIDLFNGQNFPGTGSESNGCATTTADKIQKVIDSPTGYYLNLHSTAFPKGALRGQLH